MQNQLDGGYVLNMYSQCVYCKYVHSRINENKKMTCNAFPNGIPFTIWNSEDSHKVHIDGDHGIKFEEKSELSEGE